jgi:DNA-binding NarL/FixJ family response regulator
VFIAYERLQGMTLTAQTPPPLALVHQPDLVVHLTPREREVLSLIAEGHGNAAICGQLWIGAKTLERHVQNIFTKLDLPPDTDRHRRVCAVLAWLRSPVSRGALYDAQRMRTLGPLSPR